MSQLEAIQDTVKQLTGAVNAQIELIKKIDQRLLILEQRNVTVIPDSSSLSVPKNEQDLKDISKLPDCVKELQVFDGDPVQYISWVHSVESILSDYDIVRTKPIYRAILQSIRHKIRGRADSALISYNIFDNDWPSIKKCLSLHYADKRDLRTLEYQLGNLVQRNATIDQFYANVNHQFSLIVNKIKTEDYAPETISVLIETYRNRALDVFIRGLNGDLSKMLMIQRPSTLPEAYSSCLEIQNLNYRNFPVHKKNPYIPVTAPTNQIPLIKNERPAVREAPRPMSLQQKNLAYNIQHQPDSSFSSNSAHKNYYQQSSAPPPRPIGPKPPVPMDVDRSVQTRQVNYMNRPAANNIAGKRDNDSEGHARKQQRLFHVETSGEDSQFQNYVEQFSDYEEYQEEEEREDEVNAELNFMTAASPAYPT